MRKQPGSSGTQSMSMNSRKRSATTSADPTASSSARDCSGRLVRAMSSHSIPAHLWFTVGEHHKKQRKMLNPVFSIAHMRRMIPIFNQVGHRVSSMIVWPSMPCRMDV